MTFKPVLWPEVIDDTCWIFLSAAMQKEKTILNTRTSPENLRSLYENGLAIVIMDEAGILVGFISAWPVEPGFVELGSAWVHPDLRGAGIGRMLYSASKKLDAMKSVIVFAITQNPISLKAGLHAGLTQHTDWNHPIPWHLTCGPCDQVSEDKKPMCPHRNATCWLRMFDARNPHGL